jgi:hypothetical protein
VHCLRKPLFLLVVTVLILLNASFAFSAGSVSISSGGNGVFDLQGSGFSGVAGAKITISYDTATLANARVVQGGLMSGGMMAVNTSPPGTIVLALVSTTAFNGSGSIATITFDLLPGESLGRIQSLAAELYGLTGGKTIASTSIYNPTGSRTQDATGKGTTTSDTQGSQQKTDATTTSTTGSGGTTVPVVGGSVNMPGEGGTAKGEPKGAEAAESATKQKELQGEKEAGEAGEKPQPEAAAAGDTAKKTESKSVSYPSVQERFRTYAGSRTVEALVALFDRNDMAGIRQEPPVALSDGATHVTVYINLPTAGKDAPNFAFTNAKYLSMKMAGENIWEVEMLPDTGAISAEVKVLLDGAITGIPLAVAPPLPAGVKIGSGMVSEADFIQFLNERGTVKAPRFDLNGDGTRDYIDDYIFTANYLVKQDSRKKANIKEQK